MLFPETFYFKGGCGGSAVFSFLEVEKRPGGHAMDESEPADVFASGNTGDLSEFNRWLDASVGEPPSDGNSNVVPHGSGVYDSPALLGFACPSPVWPLENGGTCETSEVASLCPSPSLEPDVVPVFEQAMHGPQPTVRDHTVATWSCCQLCAVFRNSLAVYCCPGKLEFLPIFLGNRLFLSFL